MARRREARERADRLLVACACWAGGVFVFFSLAGTKLPSYLFPAFPALALLVGGCGISNMKPTTDNRPLAFSNGKPTTSTGQRKTQMTGCQLSVVGFQLLWIGVPSWLDRLAPWLIGVTAAALALGFAAVPWILDALRLRTGGLLDGVAAPVGVAWWLAGLVAVGTTGSLLVRGGRRAAILAAMMSVLIFTAEGAVAPRVYAVVQGPLREFAEDARQILGGQGTLVVYGLNAPTIVFYANHPVTPLGPGSPDGMEQIRRLLEAGRPLVVITRIMHLPRLDAVPGLFRLKARGGYAIYSSARQAEDNLKFQTDN